MMQKVLLFFIPESVKRKKLMELFALTFDAFQSEMPELEGLSFEDCLLGYAKFTRDQSERYLTGRFSDEEVKDRMYKNAYNFGVSMRKSLHIKKPARAVWLLELIYKLIGIDFHCDRRGEFIIKQCYFSKFYSSGVCMLISSLDEGLAAGLSDGGRLCFGQRITEGCGCCKGVFDRSCAR